MAKKSTVNAERISTVTLTDRYGEYNVGGITPSLLASVIAQANSGDYSGVAPICNSIESRDAHISSVLQTRKYGILGLDYNIEPYSQDSKDINIAEFVNECILDINNFDDALYDFMDAVFKGFAVAEIMWDYDGRNYITELITVPQNKITWTNSTSPRLLTAQQPYTGIPLEENKFVVHIHKTRTTSLPTKQGLFQCIAWLYIFKSFAMRSWARFSELYGMPLRLGKYDASARDEDVQALYNALKSLGNDAAGVISQSTMIEFIEASKSSSIDVYQVLIDTCNSEISKAVLGQTLSTEQTGNGSYAMAKVHNDVRDDIRNADCEILSNTIRNQIIRPLVEFNFGNSANLPFFKFLNEEEEDMQAEANKIKILVDSGLDTIPIKWIHDKFGIPQPEGDEETLKPSSSQPFTSQFKRSQTHVNTASAVDAEDIKEQSTVDILGVKVTNESDMDKQSNEMGGVIEKLIKESGSYDEILSKLAKLYPQMNDKGLIDMLTRVLFVGKVYGQAITDNTLEVK